MQLDAKKNRPLATYDEDAAAAPILPMTDTMHRSALKTAKRDEPFDAVRASYNGEHDTLNLTFRNGISVTFPRIHIRELASKSSAELAEVEIQPGGDGLSFPRTDVDISVLGLLREEFGTLFALARGRRTKSRTSPKKSKSSRENGKKGGRPSKKSKAA